MIYVCLHFNYELTWIYTENEKIHLKLQFRGKNEQILVIKFCFATLCSLVIIKHSEKHFDYLQKGLIC